MSDMFKPIICSTIKWGDLYTADDVNKLFNAVKRNTRRDIKFYCMTEDGAGLDPEIVWLPLISKEYEQAMLRAQKNSYHKKGALRKIELFNPEIYSDSEDVILVLDIDVLITGSVDELVDFEPGQVVMRKTFGVNPKPFSYGQGSVIKFEPKRHSFLYSNMVAMPEKMVEMSNGSEQSYTSISASSRGYLSFYPDHWICSFKYHCRPRKPLNIMFKPKPVNDCKVICFHGKPDIKEAIRGYRGKFFDMTRKAEWIKNYWF